MAFNQCHKKRCAINTKSSLANCTCGFTARWQKEKINRLREKVAKGITLLKRAVAQLQAKDKELAELQPSIEEWPVQTRMRSKTMEEHIEKIKCLFGDKLFDAKDKEIEAWKTKLRQYRNVD